MDDEIRVMTIRLPKTEHEAIRLEALKRSVDGVVSMNDLVRSLCREGLERTATKKEKRR